MHRGGFEPPYLLRGTDLQSVGFNHSPTCANPKTSGRTKTPAQKPHRHRSALLSSGNKTRELPPDTASPENGPPENTLYGVPLCCAASARCRAQPLLFPESCFSGAGEGNRTPDPLITNQMLYRLSYASRWKQVQPGTVLPWSPPEVRDNYLSYHKGNSGATAGLPLVRSRQGKGTPNYEQAGASAPRALTAATNPPVRARRGRGNILPARGTLRRRLRTWRMPRCDRRRVRRAWCAARRCRRPRRSPS